VEGTGRAALWGAEPGVVLFVVGGVGFAGKEERFLACSGVVESLHATSRRVGPAGVHALKDWGAELVHLDVEWRCKAGWRDDWRPCEPRDLGSRTAAD